VQENFVPADAECRQTPFTTFPMISMLMTKRTRISPTVNPIIIFVTGLITVDMSGVRSVMDG
jgi:hypothetical protein